MGGFFGAVSKRDTVLDVFFGTDYHSHLGTRRGGMAAYDETKGLQRKIHKIENSPFRTKFENISNTMRGNAAIGSISDSDAQPLLVRSKLGLYAICIIGLINNKEKLVEDFLFTNGGHFGAMTNDGINSTELVAAMINQKDNFADGIAYAQSVIDGTASILILTDDGRIIAARDRMGRIPVLIGVNDEGYCVSFEDFAYKKLGYEDYKELGPGEVVEFTADSFKVLREPGTKTRICAFLWSYYGYSTSCYEGINVEVMRYNNGRIMAEADRKSGIAQDIDYVSGIPDSGTPHAIGYAHESRIQFTRPFIKYTPTWSRSFTPANQNERNRVAKMKQIPVHDLIYGKKLLFVDDSIVRGTQLRETVDFLYENGAKEVHIRSACPPIMYSCKYLNFSRATSEMELIARRTIAELEGEDGFKYINEYTDSSTERGKRLRSSICEKMHFTSLEFQSIDGIIKAIGLPADKVCTYCWTGKE
ncbi:MAG: amidophosphoribosyltransferase [Ruminococcaceae bacterium]|nr:amidophosphoribosyltransferase [Oscillospiraceae bacterium]MBQ6873007.1 amidophosphoribosyltransferase [Clostridia bacterium]